MNKPSNVDQDFREKKKKAIGKFDSPYSNVLEFVLFLLSASFTDYLNRIS